MVYLSVKVIELLCLRECGFTGSVAVWPGKLFEGVVFTVTEGV